MTGVETFRALAPDLLAAVEAERPPAELLGLVRRALIGLEHYDLPQGVKVEVDPVWNTPAWVVVCQAELKTPNWFMNDWRRRKQLKQGWLVKLRDVIARIEGVASWAGLEAMGRAPRCDAKMALQLVRLSPSVKHFIRDEDNSAFCGKQLSDAMKEVGLVREDRREWLSASPLLQDVCPITVASFDKKGRPVQVGIDAVVFILRPALVSSRFSGVSVHDHAETDPVPSSTRAARDRDPERPKLDRRSRRALT